MAKRRTEQIDLNINAVTNSALKNIDDVYKKFDQLDTLLDKVTNKGSINGNNISGKDSMRVDKGTEELQRGIQSLNETLRNLNSTRNDINKGHVQGSGKDVEQLNTVIKELTSAMSRVYTRGGYDGNHTDTNINNKVKTVKDYRLNPDKGIANQGRSTTDLAEELYQQRQLKQSANIKPDSMLKPIIKANDRFSAKGYVSYDEYTSQQSLMGRAGADIKRQQASNSGNLDMLQKQREGLVGHRTSLLKDSEENPENLSKNNQKIQAIEKELSTVDNLTVSLRHFKNKLDETQQSLNIQKQSLETGVKSGNISVGADPNSVKGQLGKRRLAIGLSAVAGAGKLSKQWSQQGGSARQEMEGQTVGLAIARANETGNVENGASNSYEKQLTSMGVKNGSNYTGTEVSQLAGAYTSSTGNSKDAMKVANDSSQFARFSNVGLAGTQQVISTLGQSGAVQNGSDLKGLESTIESSINNSNMSAKASEQVTGLNNILSNMSSQKLSKSQVKDVTGFQAQMSKYGANMQGAQGAQVYNSLAGIATGGFNDPTARMMFGGNDPQYAGLEGQAKLYEAMTESGAHPKELMNMVGNVDKTTGHSTVRSAQAISQMSNGEISMNQAKSLIDMQRTGKTSKKDIDKVLKKNEGKGKEAYQDSGVSTLDQAQAQLQKDTVGVSEAFDSLRNATNSLKKNMSPMQNATASAGGSMLGSIGGAVLGGVISSIGGKSISKLGGKVFSKVAPKVTSKIFGKSATKAVAKAGVTAGGKNVIKSGVKLGSKAVTKAGTKTAVKTGEKVLGKSLLKGAGKGGLKSVPLLGTALGVGWDAMDAFSKDKSTASSGKGGLIGSGIGGVIGGIAGSIIPGAGTAAGAVLGSGIGGVAGNFIGGMFGGGDSKGKSKKKQSTTEKRAVKANSESKEDKNIAENKKVVKSYNTMLDKANKTIAKAKGTNGSDGFNISGSVGGDSGTDSDTDKVKSKNKNKDKSKDKDSKKTKSLNGLNKSTAPMTRGATPAMMSNKMAITVNANNIDKKSEDLGYQIANGLQVGMQRANNEFYSKDTV